MKLNLIMAALFATLAIPATLYADETVPAAPVEAEDTVRTAPAGSIASQPAGQPRKVTPGKTGRKVATDYAPAQDLLLSAMSLIGVKYKWGGDTPESGLDCSGFIRYVFQNSLNIALPRTALGMSRVGDTIDKHELKPGDLVFFNTLKRKFSHAGIYLGDNRFIHAPRTGKNIEIANMSDRYWTSRFDGARRMNELDSENIDVAALLENRPARKQAAIAVPAQNQTCRKVTTVRKGKKTTRTVCSTPAVSKPATAKPSRKTAKPAGSIAKKKTGKKSATPKKRN